MIINNQKFKKIAIPIIANFLKYIFFISFSFVVLYPFFYIALGSVKGYHDYLDPTVGWIPNEWNFANLEAGAFLLKLPNSLFNTISLQLISGFLEFFSCAVAAYGLARYKFKGNAILKAVMVLTILVPNIMIIIPSYVNYSQLDFLGILSGIEKIIGVDLRPSILDTPFAFWIPSFFGVGLKGGLFIYIYLQFFKGLPKELEEAAWIDGAGPIKTFLQIVLPSSGSALITVLLFSIVWHWNEYFTSQMYASNLPTLSTALYSANVNELAAYFGDGVTAAQLNFEAALLAACFIFLVPLLIFYMFIQKKFVASIATSGIVG